MRTRVRHVLVIDDNAQVREFLRLALTSSGYAARLAADGAEGVRLFRAARPDCVLCDLFMPDRDGLEVISELCRLDGRVPIVAMTGGSVVSPDDLLPAARQLGASAALRKPFTVGALRACLDGVFNAPAAAGHLPSTMSGASASTTAIPPL